MSNKIKVYLDNSATTRPDDRVIAAMQQAMSEHYYNPSSLYAPSLEVEKSMEVCRRNIQDVLKASDGQVIFTSGGTEADNLAIIGSVAAYRSGKVLYSAGEHPAVIESCRSLIKRGFAVEEIPLTPEGIVNLEAFESVITSDTILICVMQINNETGAIQPLRELGELRDKLCPEALFHVDGVQGFLRHTCHVSEMGIDSFALSGHKVHGPKGIGALWISGRQRLQPIILGGGQESALRSGTENTPGITGLSSAISYFPTSHYMREMKISLLNYIRGMIPQARVNGPDPCSHQAADHILNISFPPVMAETMLHAMEGMGVLVGNGSACSSKKKKQSHVLGAMNASSERLESAIRFSLNPYLTQEDIDYAAECLNKNYMLLKRFIRR